MEPKTKEVSLSLSPSGFQYRGELDQETIATLTVTYRRIQEQSSKQDALAMAGMIAVFLMLFTMIGIGGGIALRALTRPVPPAQMEMQTYDL